MDMLFPSALKKGDTIGIVAPSSFYDAPLIEEAKEFLTDQGFKLSFHPQINERYGQMAGTPDQKVAALHDYFKDPNIKAIMPIGAGNGAIHLLDKLNYDLIKANPKIIIGFSDTTILLNAITAKTNLVTFHGPTFARLIKIDKKWQDQTMALLMGQNADVEIDTDINAEGNIYGGCLSPFQALIGTPYQPNLNKALLMIEDSGDHTSRYDRMLGHMKQAGCLNNLSAIMLGEFLNSLESNNPFGFTIEEVIKNNLPNIPFVQNLPIGHGDNLCALPIGANAVLKNGTLSFKPLA